MGIMVIDGGVGVFPGLFGGGVTPATTRNRKKPPFRERDRSCFVRKNVSGIGDGNSPDSTHSTLF